MKYTPAAFAAKWQQRFVPNDEFRITAADLQEQTQDIADSFGAGLVNVPLLNPLRTDYPEGFEVRYSFGGVSFNFFARAAGGPFPVPPDEAGDNNWGKIGRTPVVTDLFVLYDLSYAQYQLSQHPEVVKTGVLYLMRSSGWNGVQGPTETVEVEGGKDGYARLGTLVQGSLRTPVTVDVAAGTYSTDLGGGGALPAASPTTRGGVRVGQALAVAGDVLSLQFDSGTLGINQQGEVYVLTTSGNISPAATPTNFRAHFKGGNSGQRLDWDAMPGATIYEVFRSTQGGPFGLLANVPYPYFTDTNDQQGGYVVYAVNSANGAGQSARAITQCT